jgi:hypothetical protein
MRPTGRSVTCSPRMVRWDGPLTSCPWVVQGRTELPYRTSPPIARLASEGGVIAGASGGIRHPALFSFVRIERLFAVRTPREARAHDSVVVAGGRGSSVQRAIVHPL